MNLNACCRCSIALAIFAVSLALGVGSAIAGAEGGASPAINEPFRDPDFASWVERFERSGREVYDRREQIVTSANVRRGASVADIGAGTGLFTLLFARAVGSSGKVYAVDISPTFVANIERRARAEGLQNVIGVINTQTDVRLAPASVELAFICDTYHHFEYPAATMASVHRALRPGGRVIVVDFRRIAGKSSTWVMEHVRADEQSVIREVEQAGFRYIGARDILADNYFLEFEKK